jgi:hypothetical protein
VTTPGALSPIEAAERLAAFSPRASRALDDWKAGWDGEESAYGAFHAIGAAITSKRHPLPPKELKSLLAFAERLLRQDRGDVQNMVATCLLEAIWTAARQSSFDFSRVDPYLGAESRRYLLDWDRFNETTTPGLSGR